jgi:hypothetical protein
MSTSVLSYRIQKWRKGRTPHSVILSQLATCLWLKTIVIVVDSMSICKSCQFDLYCYCSQVFTKSDVFLSSVNDDFQVWMTMSEVQIERLMVHSRSMKNREWWQTVWLRSNLSTESYKFEWDTRCCYIWLLCFSSFSVVLSMLSSIESRWRSTLNWINAHSSRSRRVISWNPESSERLKFYSLITKRDSRISCSRSSFSWWDILNTTRCHLWIGKENAASQYGSYPFVCCRRKIMIHPRDTDVSIVVFTIDLSETVNENRRVYHVIREMSFIIPINSPQTNTRRMTNFNTYFGSNLAFRPFQFVNHISFFWRIDSSFVFLFYS